MRRGSMALLAPKTDTQPAELGRMLDAREVAAIVYESRVSARWVLQNHDPLNRVKWGRTCYWYEHQSREWKQQRERQQLRGNRG